MSMPRVARTSQAVLRTVVLAGVLGAAACAPAVGTRPGASEIPRYERRLEQAGPSPRVLVPLAIAYHNAGRGEDALRALERSLAMDAEDPGTLFYLGLVKETLGRNDEARRWYADYLTVGRSRRLVADVRSRIYALDRAMLQAQVREAIAQEAELSLVEPRPNSVAVYPFLYIGADPALKPLERAFAELLSTDLALSPQLTVLERSHVQYLLDELRLGESARVDPATAPQAGRLLRAGTIVQGRIDGDAAEIGVQAAVVGVGDPDAAEPFVERDALARLFDMQKRVAAGVFRSLGIELDGPTQVLFARQATQNLQALLYFGQGLDALDDGRHADASRLFQRASALDPGFVAAGQHAQRATALGAAGTVTQSRLTQAGFEEVPLLGSGALPLEAVQVHVPPSIDRAPAPEALGTQGVGRASVVEIIIRRP